MKHIKRNLDITVSVCILLVTLPALGLVSVLIFILEGKPIIYSSQRMISPLKSIKINKFRTMVIDAVSIKYQLDKRFMRDGYLDIPIDCEVYTSIGRLLERTQIVEFLQIINVIKGEMSLVGNRPLPRENIILLSNFSNWEKRFDSPCGITGISQISGKHGLLPEQRLELEILYSKIYNYNNFNILLLDFIIIFNTFKLLLTGKYIGFENSKILLNRFLREIDKITK